MTEKSVLIIFFLMLIVGVALEYGLEKVHIVVFKKRRKTNHFPGARFLYFLLFPISAVLFVTVHLQVPVLLGFVIFALIGTVAEFCLGYSFYKIVGRKLWTYHSYQIGGYTSWLSIPLWGIAGVIFWLISRTLV